MATKAQIFSAALSGIRFDGVALSLGRLYFFEPGTTTQRAVWADRNKTTPATLYSKALDDTGPFYARLDSNGQMEIFLDGVYDIMVESSTGSQKAYWENVAEVFSDADNNLADLETSLSDYSRTLKSADLITKGPWVDVRAFMDGVAGRPTLAAWVASPTTVGVGAVINAALQAVKGSSTVQGGVVKFPEGTYLIDETIIVPQKANIEGPYLVRFPETEEPMGAVFRAKSTLLNAPIMEIMNDGTQRNANLGENGQVKTWQDNTIKNIYFHGGWNSNATLNQDAIRMQNVWHVNIIGCAARGLGGFAVRALDSNAIRIENNGFNANVYIESLADSNIVNNDLGGGNGRIIPPLWLQGINNFVNHVEGNFIYNSQPNETFQSNHGGMTFTVTTPGDPSLYMPGHPFVDRTPVYYTTTGTAPAGIGIDKRYLVTVVDVDHIKLSTTAEDYHHSPRVYTTPTTTGTGTHKLTIGPEANFAIVSDYFNAYDNKAKTMKVTGNRFDQSYYHGVIINGISELLFTNNSVIDSGFNNAVGHYGVWLLNASHNLLANNIIDGHTHDTLPQNQVIGIKSETTCSGNKYGNNVMGHHATADYSIDPDDVIFDSDQTLNTTDDVTFANVDVTADLSVGGDAGVTGALTAGSLTSGASTFNGQVNMNADLIASSASPMWQATSTNTTSGLRINVAGTASAAVFRFQYGGASIMTLKGTIPDYADNAAAVAAGLAVTTVYRTGDVLKIVH